MRTATDIFNLKRDLEKNSIEGVKNSETGNCGHNAHVLFTTFSHQLLVTVAVV
jgi:hypothetical protein